MPVASVNTGEVIFSSEPFAYALLDVEAGKRCDYCLERNDNLKNCTVCKAVDYCNKTCQKNAWKDHKRECSHLKKQAPRIPDHHSHLMAKIILKLSDPLSEKSEVTLNGVTCTFSDLVSPENEMKNDDKCIQVFQKIARVLNKLLPLENMVSMKECFEIFCKMYVNFVNITDITGLTIAIGLYLGASTIAHSCMPNAVRKFFGLKMEVIALDYIEKPSVENVFVCYVNMLDPRPIRQRLLQEYFYIDCKCPRCLDDDFDDELLFGLQLFGNLLSAAVQRSTPTGATITEIDDNSETNDGTGASLITTAVTNIQNSKSSEKISAKDPTMTVRVASTANASAGTSNQALMMPGTSTAKPKQEKLNPLGQLEERNCQLKMQVLRQQLKQKTEKHNMHMKVEAERLQAYQQQKAAFAAEERYWLNKRIREMFPMFPSFGMHF